MLRRANWGALVFALSVVAWTDRSLAESRARFHLGLETSIYSSTSVDGTYTPSGNYATSSEVKVVSKDSGFGLPGNAALSLGILLGDHWDLGARLGYRSGSAKSGAEGVAADVDTSAYTFTPYLGYLAGSRGDKARFALGVAAGLGSESSTTTSPGTTSVPSSSVETTLSQTHFGAFIGLRGFPADMLSIDPMFMLMRTSATSKSGASQEVDVTGTTVMLNVGFSLWMGGTTEVAGGVPAAAPAAASSTGATETSGAPAVPVAGTDSSGDAGAEVRSDRITLSFDDSRAATFIKLPDNAEPSVAVVLRDDGSDTGIIDCKQIALHAPNQEDMLFDVTPGMASTATRRVRFLKTSISVANLRRLVAVPLASNASVPDHWFELCAQRWAIPEAQRARLKRYLEAWPVAVSAPLATPPAAASPPATEPATR